ncbi:hypothetical protein ACB098_03G036100 [Castanea mollissima]
MTRTWRTNHCAALSRRHCLGNLMDSAKRRNPFRPDQRWRISLLGESKETHLGDSTDLENPNHKQRRTHLVYHQTVGFLSSYPFIIRKLLVFFALGLSLSQSHSRH